MSHRLLAAVALAALLLPPAASQTPQPPWQGKLSPCTLPDGGDKAFCGTYEVFENRETRSGRKIPLKIVVLPAKGPKRAPDPVFFLDVGESAGRLAVVEVSGFSCSWMYGCDIAAVVEAVSRTTGLLTGRGQEPV